jgi:hypothetical protein
MFAPTRSCAAEAIRGKCVFLAGVKSGARH